MKLIWKRLCDRVYMSAGLYRLSPDFLRFCAMHVGFLLFTNLQSVFINTLFIRLTGESDIVMHYNMLTNCVAGPFMLVSSFLVRRRPPTFSMRLGISMHIAMYLTFFCCMFLGGLAAGMPLIALLAGIGNGFYWFSYSYVINVCTTDDSRDLAISLIGVLGGIVSLSMPTIAGFVISRFTGLTGYSVMFGFSLIMAIVTILLSTRLRPAPPIERKSYLLPLLKLVAHDRNFALSLLGEYCKCIREGVCGFFFNVLLFQAVTNEAVVGVNTLLSGVASIFGAALYGKLISSKNRIGSMAVSASLLLVLAMALFWQLSPVTIILYSSINAMLGVFLMNPTFTVAYSLVLGSKKSRPMMGEYIGLRECCVGLGRITGILFTMCCPKTTAGYVGAIVALTALQYGTTAIFRYVARHAPPKEA